MLSPQVSNLSGIARRGIYDNMKTAVDKVKKGKGLRAYDSVSAARTDIAQYINWYNSEQVHSSLGDETPEQVWLSNLPPLKEAA